MAGLNLSIKLNWHENVYTFYTFHILKVEVETVGEHLWYWTFDSWQSVQTSIGSQLRKYLLVTEQYKIISYFLASSFLKLFSVINTEYIPRVDTSQNLFS